MKLVEGIDEEHKKSQKPLRFNRNIRRFSEISTFLYEEIVVQNYFFGFSDTRYEYPRITPYSPWCTKLSSLLLLHF